MVIPTDLDTLRRIRAADRRARQTYHTVQASHALAAAMQFFANGDALNACHWTKIANQHQQQIERLTSSSPSN